jgi:hypothetical protein
MSFTDQLKKRGIKQQQQQNATPKTFTQQLREMQQSNKNVSLNSVDEVQEAQDSGANKAPDLNYTPFNNPLTKIGELVSKVTPSTPKAAPSIDVSHVMNNLPLPKKTYGVDKYVENQIDAKMNKLNVAKPQKPTSLDDIKKEKTNILEIPGMAAQAVGDSLNTAKNLVYYGARAAGEGLSHIPVINEATEALGMPKNTPIEKFDINRNYTFVDDIMPNKWGAAVNKFAAEHPKVGGFTKFALENTFDPTNLIGGGTIGELAKAGVIGKNSIKGSIENLKLIGDMNKAALHGPLPKTLPQNQGMADRNKAMEEINNIVSNTELPNQYIGLGDNVPVKNERITFNKLGMAYKIPSIDEIGSFIDEKGIVNIPNNVLKHVDPKDVRDYIKAFADKNYVTHFDENGNLVGEPKPVTIKDNGKEVFITREGLREVSKNVRGKQNPLAKSMFNLPDVIKESKFKESGPDVKGRPFNWEYYNSKVNIGGEPFDANISIKQLPNNEGQRYYYHNIKKQIEPSNLPLNGKSHLPVVINDGSKNSIPYVTDNINKMEPVVINRSKPE